MLTEFRVKNYKSFLEETIFSMEAAPKQSGLDYSLMRQRIKKKAVKCLSSSVVYGPNASGKTNIIGAMDTLRAIVLRGNIRNSEENKTPNAAANALELIPNNTLGEARPVMFSISFIENKLAITYELLLDLGMFLDGEYSRRIIKEKLTVNDEDVFVREETLLKIDVPKALLKLLSDSVNLKSDELTELAKNNLSEEELFLTNGFRHIFAPKFAKMIIDWFTKKFMVIYRADSIHFIKRFSDPQKQTIYVEDMTNKAAKLFGINSNAIGYAVNEDDGDIKLCSVFKNKSGKEGTALPAEIFESYGTIRFVNMFPLVMRAIKTGSVLVVDEFDASLHPMALMSIINVFHNNDININHAQLIINTHNPIFLNSNLLRRDEIKFVERDEDKDTSVLYSLADFGTAGAQGVRKHEDYLKYYFVGRYGAIKNIDFTPIFEKLIKKEGREE